MALLLAVPLALLGPALFQGRLFAGYDTLALGLPFWSAVQRCLAAHQWPLWLPGLFGGMPGVASCNMFFAYPTALLGALAGWGLPATLALDTALHVALAGLGMFLFLRRLDRSLGAALLGALFFQLSGSQISQLNGGYQNFVEGIALAPWAFWAAHKGWKEGSWLGWGLCGLAFGLQILASAAQLFTYTFAAVACFALAQRTGPGESGGSGPWDVLKGLALAVFIAFLIAAPQLWPTLQYLPLSERHGYSYADFIDGSLGLRETLTWLVPGFFGWQEPSYDGPMGDCFTSEYLGLLPWALAAAGVAALWARERRVRWMAGLGLAALFFAQRDWTPFYGLFRHLPVLNGFRIWSRILFLATFAVCTLAAYGWDALQDPARQRRARQGALALVAAAAAVAGAAWALAGDRALADAAALHGLGDGTEAHRMTDLISAMARASAQHTLLLLLGVAAVLGALSRPRSAGLALGMALALHGLDQSQIAARFIRTVDPSTLALRMQVLGPSPALADDGEPFRVADVESHNNRLLYLGYEGVGGVESMKMGSSVRLAQAMRGRFGDWLNLFNTRFVLVPAGPPGGAVRFMANPRAYPRAWLVARARAVAGDDAADALMADPRFDPRNEVLLAADPGLPGGHADGTVAWLGHSPAAETLEVSTRQDSVLVLSNPWYPSWRCQVDGVDRPVLKADGGLQAVAL